MIQTASVYIWVWIVAFVGWFFAIYWSVWRYSKWLYYLTIALSAVWCIALTFEFHRDFAQQHGNLMLFVPLALFLFFLCIINIKYLLGETWLDLDGIRFFMDDVRAKPNPTLAEKTTVLIGYAAATLVFLICAERLYLLYVA